MIAFIISLGTLAPLPAYRMYSKMDHTASSEALFRRNLLETADTAFRVMSDDAVA